MENQTIEIDFDKKCKTCGKKGACQNGLCIKCTSKAIVKMINDARERTSAGSCAIVPWR